MEINHLSIFYQLGCGRIRILIQAVLTITHYYCWAEYRTRVINPKEDSQRFCSLCFDAGVAKANTRQSSPGLNTVLLPQRRDRARAASLVGVGPPWPVGISPGGQNKAMYLSQASVEGTLSPPCRGQVYGVGRCHMTHTLWTETEECSSSLKLGQILPH